MRVWILASVIWSLLVGLSCTQKHEPSQAERQQTRDNEVASFAKANGAAVVPRIMDSGVTLDWQEALRGPSTIFAFRGSIDDIFEKDGKYFLNVSDIDNKLLWVIQCSEAEAKDTRRKREEPLEILLLVDVTEIRPRVCDESSTEVIGTLRKFQASAAPI